MNFCKSKGQEIRALHGHVKCTTHGIEREKRYHFLGTVLWKSDESFSISLIGCMALGWFLVAELNFKKRFLHLNPLKSTSFNLNKRTKCQLLGYKNHILPVSEVLGFGGRSIPWNQFLVQILQQVDLSTWHLPEQVNVLYRIYRGNDW